MAPPRRESLSGLASPVSLIASHSAVAILYRPDPCPALLMIQRAVRAGDPWSGDMAFPGGRREPQDTSHLVTARRELLEETGISITDTPVTKLKLVWTKSHNSFRPMAIHPYLFRSKGDVDIVLSHEAERAVWVPLRVFQSNLTQKFIWRTRLGNFRMPCHYYQGLKIWGLSLRMIQDLKQQNILSRDFTLE